MMVIIGERLRTLRVEKGLSQGDVEHRTGMLRCYISRIENGHTIPSLETLERFAGVLDVPLHKLFYSGEGEPSTPNPQPQAGLDEVAEETGNAGEQGCHLTQLKSLVSQLGNLDRDILLALAEKLATR